MTPGVIHHFRCLPPKPSVCYLYSSTADAFIHRKLSACVEIMHLRFFETGSLLVCVLSFSLTKLFWETPKYIEYNVRVQVIVTGYTISGNRSTFSNFFFLIPRHEILFLICLFCIFIIIGKVFSTRVGRCKEIIHLYLLLLLYITCISLA